MAANREVRGLSEESAKLAEAAGARDGEVTDADRVLLNDALGELEALPTDESHFRAVIELDQRYRDDLPRIQRALKAEILRGGHRGTGREAEAEAPGPQHRRRAKGETPPESNVGANTAIQAAPTSSDDPIEPVVGDLTRPMPMMPGFPQQWPSPVAGELWYNDQPIPRSTSGDPLPPRPAPPTPSRGTP